MENVTNLRPINVIIQEIVGIIENIREKGGRYGRVGNNYYVSAEIFGLH